jgi:hypothetical protein
MHTVETLEGVLELAAQAGYQVRHEWLGGSGGGVCVLLGQKCLFVDLALHPADQLDRVLHGLRGDPAMLSLPAGDELRRLLAGAKSN